LIGKKTNFNFPVKNAVIAIVFFTLNICIVWIWTKTSEPTPSKSISLLFTMPTIFACNIIIGMVLAVFKKKLFAILFFINSLFTPILEFQFFNYCLDYNLQKQSQRFEFHSTDAENNLIVEIYGNEYSIFKYANNLDSILIIEGGLIEEKKIYWNNEKFHKLKTSKYDMFLYEYKLVNYQNKGSTINLTRVVR